MISLVKKDYDSTKIYRKTHKKGASQTYDTPSFFFIIRDTQVILDRDVAELYGVTTKVVNQAIRNNPDKFPSGYVIELTNSEKEYVVKNFDHLESHQWQLPPPLPSLIHLPNFANWQEPLTR